MQHRLHHPHETHLHLTRPLPRRPTIPSWPWLGRTLASALALSIALADAAHAFTPTQGPTLQGAPLREVSLQAQGTVAGWLEGPPITATTRTGGTAFIMSMAGPRIATVMLAEPPATSGFVRLRPGQLTGLRWSERICRNGRCTPIYYRIVATAIDRSKNTMASHADNSDVPLFELEYSWSQQGGPGDWHNPCASSEQPHAMGLFVDGRWRPDGSWYDDGYTFSCTGGVIAKCARQWGYKPWRSLSSEGRTIALQPLHQACTRAARADYCGDGVSHTSEGTIVELFDRYHFNQQTRWPNGRLEAGFSERGAGWLRHLRIPKTRQAISGTSASGARSCLQNGPRLPHGAHDVLLHVWSTGSPAGT